MRPARHLLGASPAPLLRLDVARERLVVGRRRFRRLDDAGLVTSHAGTLASDAKRRGMLP